MNGRPSQVLLLFVTLLALAPIAACGDGDSGEPPPATSSSQPTISVREPTELELPIQVVVTVPLFEDFVRAAGKANVEVSSVVPRGSSAQSYVPTPSDLEMVFGSRFFFYNGLRLDATAAEAVEKTLGDETSVVPFAPNIRSPRGSELGNPDLTAELAGDNPLLWLDPVLAYGYVEVIADEFVIYDGVRQGFYDDNFAAYRDEMVELRDELASEIEKIPPKKRKLVTANDSFEHFARRFGLEVSGFVSSDAAVDALVARVRSDEIPAVFAEYGHDNDLIGLIASRAGVELCTLYSDVLPDGVNTYAEMMRRNAAELVRCLGGG